MAHFVYDFSSFMDKASSVNHVNSEFGCVMLKLSVPEWDKFLKEIDPEDSFDPDNHGLERYPHVTLIYGIHDWDEPDWRVLDIVRGFEPVKVRLAGISLFKNPQFDVVKFDVEGERLSAMNRALSDNLQCTIKFPEYHAHATIAYVKPGAGERYANMPNSLESKEFTLDEVIYSKSGRVEKISIKLQG